MGLFSIFNKTRLSLTGKADICSYNSFPNTVAGWLITSFNWAKRWENYLIHSSILPFRLQQQSHGTLLYLRLNDIWFNHDCCKYCGAKKSAGKFVFVNLIHCLIHWNAFISSLRHGKCFPLKILKKRKTTTCNVLNFPIQ